MAKAEVLNDLGHLDEAREALTNALVLNPTYDEAWVFRGNVSLELGDPEEARRCFEEALRAYDVALELEPGNGEVLRLRAKLLEELARDDEALPAYALAAKAGHAPAMAALAGLLLRDGRPAEAVAAARDLAGRAPPDADAHALLGLALLQAGSPSDAIPALEKSRESAPRPRVRRNLAGALARTGRTDDGLRALASPGDAEDRLLRGEILREARRFPEALAAYDAAIATGAHLDVAYLERSRALADAGRFPEALASLDAALGLSSEDPEVWREHGGIALKAGRPRTALPSLERATEIHPPDSAAWGLRAEALAALGRTKEAERCRQRANGPALP